MERGVDGRGVIEVVKEGMNDDDLWIVKDKRRERMMRGNIIFIEYEGRWLNPLTLTWG